MVEGKTRRRRCTNPARCACDFRRPKTGAGRGLHQHGRRYRGRRSFRDRHLCRRGHAARRHDRGRRENLSLAWPGRRIDVRLNVGYGAHLAGCRRRPSCSTARARPHHRHRPRRDASLALCEIVVFGRTAMSETMRQGRLSIAGGAPRREADFCRDHEARWRIAATLARKAVANGGVAIGTALIVPGDEALLEAHPR